MNILKKLEILFRIKKYQDNEDEVIKTIDDLKFLDFNKVAILNIKKCKIKKFSKENQIIS